MDTSSPVPALERILPRVLEAGCARRVIHLVPRAQNSRKSSDKLSDLLSHKLEFLPRVASPAGACSADEVIDHLRSSSSGDRVVVVSEDVDYQARSMDLVAAVRGLHGRGMSSLVLCATGRRGWYAGEDSRDDLILCGRGPG